MPAIKSEISAISSEKNLPSREILIVDQHVEANEILLAGLARPIEIVALEPYLPPIEQIATILANHPGIETLHILAHGEPGALALAGQMLGTADLAHQSAALASIKDSLAASAEIALWACSVAANTDGRIFVDALEAATGARVFAADRPVGAASGGGTWDIGTASPFGAAAMAAYPHTLPTFDFTGGSGNGTATYTETESGVTMTVVDDTGDTASVFNAGTAAGLSGDAIAFGGTGSLTVTFDQGVTVTSFRYVEDDGSLVGTDSVIFTPIGGTGSTITKLPGDFANSGFDVTPADWVGVTGFTVTYIGTTPIDPILDTIVFNVAPTVTGEPTDLIVTEDAAGNLDLSSVTVADSDGDNLTVTLSVDSGTFSTPGDGATAGFGVIETLVNSTTITLVGDAASINFYLDTASNIQYTGASNANGNDVATLTITPNDGTIDGTAATVNIDITAANDAPVLDNTGSPTLAGINENAGDDDSSGADGDDDATNNANNSGTTVASLVVDGSITDVDGSAVESIAVTAVDNTNGVWQYSTDSGTNWLNFSGTTGSNVDIESAARLLFSTNLVRFVPNANYSGTATINFRAWDEIAGAAGDTANVATNGGGTSYSAAQETATITVSAVNDPPTVSGEPTDLIVTEDTASNLDLSGVMVADGDGDSLTVTFSVDAGTFSTPADGSGVGSSVTETLVNATTITLAGTAADINTYLDTASNVQYTSASNANGNDAATLTITPNDGTESGTAATSNIDITAVNDAPTVTGVPADVAVTEDTVGYLDLSAITFADVDSAANVTVTLTASEGTLTALVTADVVTITGSGTNTLTLVGTVAEINASLDPLPILGVSNIQYTGAANAVGNDAATVSVTANDGNGSGDVALGTINLDITAVNDLPTGSNATVSIDEDTTHTLTAANFGFSDVDAGDAFVSVRIDTITLSAGDMLQLSGTDVTDADVISIANINAGNLVYTPAPDANGNALLTFTFSVNDGTAFAASPSTLTVDVAPVSDNARPGEPSLSNASVAENAEGAVVGTLTSIDPDGDAVSFSVLGDARFEVVDGILKLQEGVSLNFEDNDSVRVTVRAVDDQGGSFIKTFTVAVTDVNEAVAVGGTDTADTVDGSDDADALYGAGGDDTVGGGLGDDKLGGGGGADTLDGGSGGDILFGGGGNDELSGGTGDDVIYNGSGADSVNGGTGSDTIWAGAGDDILTGGTGADTFIFGATSGNDRITDFNASEDTLDLQYSGAGFASLAGVEAASSETTIDGDAGVLIDLGGDQSVFLAGLGLGDLASVTLVL